MGIETIIGVALATAASVGAEEHSSLQQRQQAHHNETQATEDAAKLQKDQADKQKQQDAASQVAQQTARQQQLRQLQGLQQGSTLLTSPSSQGAVSTTAGKSVLGV